jgi:hypothetical protein
MKLLPTFLSKAWILLTVLLIPACNNSTPEPTTDIRVNSLYFAMNPMDIEFDTIEMKMIEKALAEYIEAYRA